MSKSKTLKGIIAYPITPFDSQENVDIQLFKKLTDKLVTSGAHAIAPLGSTGVLPYLNDEEKEAVVEATIEVVAGRVPVVAGVSNLTTERTIYHARFAEAAGAAAVMIIPMSYWKLTDDEIFAHYRSVAEAISIPIMAYNNPATCNHMSIGIRDVELASVGHFSQRLDDVDSHFRNFRKHPG